MDNGQPNNFESHNYEQTFSPQEPAQQQPIQQPTQPQQPPTQPTQPTQPQQPQQPAQQQQPHQQQTYTSQAAQTAQTPQTAPWMRQQQYVTGPGMSTKSKIVACLFGIFFGGLGVHNFYLGKTGRGIIQLLLTLLGWIFFGLGPVASCIWGLVEGIEILGSHPGSQWHTDGNNLQLQD